MIIPVWSLSYIRSEVLLRASRSLPESTRRDLDLAFRYGIEDTVYIPELAREPQR